MATRRRPKNAELYLPGNSGNIVSTNPVNSAGHEFVQAIELYGWTVRKLIQ
jgi:hypothetical protein